MNEENREEVVIQNVPCKCIALKDGSLKIKPKHPEGICLAAHLYDGKIVHIDEEHYNPYRSQWEDYGNIKEFRTVQIVTQASTTGTIRIPENARDYVIGYDGLCPGTISIATSGSIMNLVTANSGTIEVAFFN